MTIGIVGVAFFAARLDGVLSVRIASPSCGHSANPIWVARDVVRRRGDFSG
jgi:hypothetical protein